MFETPLHKKILFAVGIAFILCLFTMSVSIATFTFTSNQDENYPAESKYGLKNDTIKVSLKATRNSGVAPLSVFFDATQTTSPMTAHPFHDLNFEYSFGDPDAGIWTNTGKDKNEAQGAVAAHVFEHPGIYTITLTVRDPNNSNNITTKQVTVTVDDPELVFAGTNTLCFSNSGNWMGCPSGAGHVVANQTPIINTNLLSDKRLLLERGGTFNGDISFTSGKHHGHLGAYGTGNRPVVNGSINASWPPNTPYDWRISGIEFAGTGEDNIPGETLVIDSKFTGKTDGVMQSGFREDEVAIVSNYFSGSQDYNIYSSYGKYFAVLGNTLNAVGHEHLIRTYMSYVVMEHNDFEGGAPNKHQLKFCSLNHSDLPLSQYNIVSNNLFKNIGPIAWITGFGPENNTDGFNTFLKDTIIENNEFDGGSIGGKVAISSAGATDITIRNNTFRGVDTVLTSAAPPTGQVLNNISFLHNTIYSTGNGFNGLFVLYTQQPYIPISGVVLKNNILSAPNTSGRIINLFNTANQEITDFHNLWYTQNPSFRTSNGTYDLPSWQNQNCNSSVRCGEGSFNADPLFVNVNASDYHLQTNSPAINKGSVVPVLKDKDGYLRELRPDIGAYEFLKYTYQ